MIRSANVSALPLRFSGRPTNGDVPVLTRRTVYIQSDTAWNADGSVPNIFGDLSRHGLDPKDTALGGYKERDGTDINNPFRTLDGFYDYYALIAPASGLWLDVVLLGDTRAGTWDNSNLVISIGRVYWQHEITDFVSPAYDHAITFRGPRGGFKRTSGTQLNTVTDVLDARGRNTGTVKLTFAGPMNVASYHLQWLRNDGREVWFPIPGLFDHPGADSNSVIMPGAAISYTTAIAGGTGNTFYQWTPSVLVHTQAGDAQMKSVHMNLRNLPFRVGDRTSANSPSFDANHMGIISRISIGRSTWNVSSGQALIGEGVRFGDNTEFHGGGSVRLRGCAVEGFAHFMCDGRTLTNDSQLIPNEEATGYMKAFTLPLSATRYTGVNDPDDPISGIDFACGASANNHVRVGGPDVGCRGGSLRSVKGIHVYNPQSGYAVKVYGKDSKLFLRGGTINSFTLAAATDVGIWAVDGASVFTNDSDETTIAAVIGTKVSGTDLHYRAGKGSAILGGAPLSNWQQSHAYVVGNRVKTSKTAGGNGFVYECTVAGTSSGAGTGPTGTGSAIVDGGVTWKYVAAGQLRDTETYNGLFTRRHELSTNGYPTDDESEIKDVLWLPVNYTEGI